MAESGIKTRKLKKVGSINLNGLPVKVQLADEIFVGNGKVDECWGCAHWPTSQVIVSRAMSKENREVILLHELIHIISSQNSLSLSEEQVDRLATALNGMEKNNPGWRKLVHG